VSVPKKDLEALLHAYLFLQMRTGDALFAGRPLCIENKLHHPKDRTWQVDRHWLAHRRGAEALAMPRTLEMDLMRRARLPGLDPTAFFPERIEHFQRYPKRAAGLVVRTTIL
jgi:hypothetical protein